MRELNNTADATAPRGSHRGGKEKMMEQIFQIGSFCFRLCWPDEIKPPPHFMRFAASEGRPEYTYRIRISDIFPEAGEKIAEREDLLVGRTPEGECRMLGVKGRTGYYACYWEMSEKEAEIILSPDRLLGLSIDPVFTSLLALERRMLGKEQLILHCAYLCHEKEAVLFSAPSETGKTTQAKLWETYAGSRIINGDRALLGQVVGRWTAHGWPVCGTSEECLNEAYPVRAIVMLRRGESDQVRRLNASEAFRLLYMQITVNGWNRESVTRVMDLIEQLLTRIPVYELTCTISEHAVYCLKDVLYPGKDNR